MKKKLVIFGTGQIAEIAYEYFTYDSEYEVSAFTVDREYLKSSMFKGLEVIPFEELEKYASPDRYYIFIALGYRDMNRLRAMRFKEAKSKGYKIATYVSSEAFVWRNVKIGEGSFIFENNVLQPFVEIGVNTVLWSGNHIGHHSKIGDHCFITSHVVISGNVYVGSYSFIGVNATIVNDVKIAKGTFIGANALITKNTSENSSYLTHSAKKVDISPDKLLK